MSILRDVRTVLHRTCGRCRCMPGLLTSERLSAMCLAALETFPVLGQPIIRVWLVLHTVPAVCAGVTTPQCTLTCVAHVYPFMGIVAFPSVSTIRFGGFAFFLPAFDPRLPGARRGKGLSPVHQGGRSFLRYRLLFTVSLTCMDMQLRKSNDFRRPSPISAVGFGRTGRTHCVSGKQ